MNEENGSAEEQAQRLDEGVDEARTLRRRGRGESYARSEWSAGVGPIRRFGRRVLTNPAGPLIVGLALIAGSAAMIALRNDRGRPVLRSLRRRSHALAESLRDPDLAVRPRAFSMLARLAAAGLAGVTWRWARAIVRDRTI